MPDQKPDEGQQTMAMHHTKDKGDLGTAKAHADLVGLGFTVLFPATEHAAFDLVAYRDGTFHRVQVKYRSARSGTISVQFRSVWADRNGTHMKPSDKAEVDVLCIYCPQTDSCYYLRPTDFRRSVTLRLVPSKNGQQRGVLPIAAFRAFPTNETALAHDAAPVSS
ncbi:group I intron-associated PD-(D/E)XK endonuclease [Nocardioides allogilvus]|uniref:group I intron-associated PD-(D/E)XK endonuclease n=1 Tax=Nocardioides allogilvus TaxID=2072017 RepID=UPI001E49A703|nr:group I intron-associated PD-(D/E)XK endonuclease [Nocardioides allogilvus]